MGKMGDTSCWVEARCEPLHVPAGNRCLPGKASGCCGPWGVFQPSHPWLAVAVGSIPCALRGLFVRSGGTGPWRGRVGAISEQKACPLSPGECLTRALLLESAWALFWQPRDSEEMHERVSGALLCWRSGCAASEHGCEEKSLRALTSGGGGGAGRREGVAVTQWCARCSVFIPCLVCRGVGWPTLECSVPGYIPRGGNVRMAAEVASDRRETWPPRRRFWPVPGAVQPC